MSLNSYTRDASNLPRLRLVSKIFKACRRDELSVIPQKSNDAEKAFKWDKNYRLRLGAFYLQAPMSRPKFQHPQPLEISLLPNHIRCHQLHRQRMPVYLQKNIPFFSSTSICFLVVSWSRYIKLNLAAQKVSLYIELEKTRSDLSNQWAKLMQVCFQ